MNDSWFEQIEAAAAFLNIDLGSQEMANLCVEYDLNDASVQAVIYFVTIKPIAVKGTQNI